jgi:hypothetical protein
MPRTALLRLLYELHARIRRRRAHLFCLVADNHEDIRCLHHATRSSNYMLQQCLPACLV